MPPKGNGELPDPKPRPGAELFASIPTSLFFAVMFHAFFQAPPKGMSTAQIAKLDLEKGSHVHGLHDTSGGKRSEVNLQSPQSVQHKRLLPHAALWQVNDPFEFHAYLSTSEEETFASRDFRDDEQKPAIAHPQSIETAGRMGLIWHETNLWFNPSETPTSERTFERNFTMEEIPQPWRNESVYLHFYFSKTSKPGVRHEYDMGTEDVQHGVIPLVLYVPRPKAKRTQNLISGDISEKDKAILLENERLNITDDREDEIIPLWKTELYVHLVNEVNTFPRNGIPSQMLEHMDIDEDTGKYWPIVHMNEFWLMRSKMPPVNETLKELPLKLTFNVADRVKWLMTVQWSASMAQQMKMGTASVNDQDEMKRVFLETNPWMLGLTGAVSILHSVFDFLAFKNDISFWRKVDTMKGLSVRSIFTSIVTQSIIFLYLCDNDASWIILISSGVGLLIEIWKVKKAMNVSFDASRFPYVILDYKDSYSSETLKYDQMAMKYLSYILYPLSLGFSCYSLGYNQYKSWYSWLLSSAVGCVYTFGFIMMTPQLFINYKLKSVAHLPWRAMVYKFLNTIIDDLFAFIIKMPTLHRLSCFRDDIIFLIYIYQRWAYQVDRTRVNEYGLVAKDMDEIEGKSDVSADKGKPAIKDGAAGSKAPSKSAAPQQATSQSWKWGEASESPEEVTRQMGLNFQRGVCAAAEAAGGC